MDEKFQKLLREYTTSPSDDLAHRIANMLLRQRGAPEEVEEPETKSESEQTSIPFEELTPEQQAQVREILDQLPQMLSGLDVDLRSMTRDLNRDMRSMMRDMRNTFGRGFLDAFGRGFNL